MANYSPTKVKLNLCGFCKTPIMRGEIEGLPVRLSPVFVPREDTPVLMKYGLELVEVRWQPLTRRVTYQFYDEYNHRAGIEKNHWILTQHICGSNLSRYHLW